MKDRKGYLTSHAKSSAAVVSLIIHAVFLIIAISFVAVSVITKDDIEFEAKPVNRPKMELKKLQVPVNMKKAKPKPRLRKRIVSKPKMNQSMPDLKMPEISGVKGGIGNSGGSGMGGAGVGFSLPEIKVFGVKTKGEKVFIVLDASDRMMYDEMGGIAAFTLIKEELVRIIDGLPSTSLFNISVHDKWNTFMLFPKMVPATEGNVTKVYEWLKPLNAVRSGMGSEEWGPRTLGPGGSRSEKDLRTGIFKKDKTMEAWHRPVMLAMEQQADAVFVLTHGWGYHRYALTERDKAWYDTPAGEKYMENYKKALRMLDEDNRKRKENGQPPRAISRSDKRKMVKTYVPGGPLPPEPQFYYFSPKEFIESMVEVRRQYSPKDVQTASGLGKRGKKDQFSFSVIHFARVGEKQDEKTINNFKQMTSKFRGKYRTLSGLGAIQSQVSAGSYDPDAK